jgi:hypothetical protein
MICKNARKEEEEEEEEEEKEGCRNRTPRSVSSQSAISLKGIE